MFKKILFFLGTFCFVFFCFSYVTTYGSFEFHGFEERGAAYDSLGKSLLNMEADIDPEAINWEGFDINGKKYMYFGPFPAFIRIILNKISPEHFGYQARVSCLIALCIIFTTLFFAFNFALSKNKNLKINKNLILGISLIAFLFGTPLFFLLSCSWIYHESILWALVWSFIGFSTCFYILYNKSFSCFCLSLLGICASFCFLSKTTFALPLYLLCAYFFVKIILKKENVLKRLFFLSSSASLGIAFQAWYNFKRFGNVFYFFDIQNFYMQAAKDYGMFNIKRFFTSIYYYLVPTSRFFRLDFPFFVVDRPEAGNNPLFFEWQEPTIPLTISCLFFVLLVCFFIFSKKEKKGFYSVFLPLLLVSTLEAVLICCYVFITERFLAEFLPLIFCLMLFMLLNFKQKRVFALFSTLSAFSVLITILSSICILSEYGIVIPKNWRSQLLSFSAMDAKKVLDNEHKKTFLAYQNERNVKFSFEKPRIQFDKNEILAEDFVQNANNAILLHANSEITYNVPKNAELFEGILNTSYQARQCKDTSVAFQIFNEYNKPISKKIILGPQEKYFKNLKLVGFSKYPYHFRISLNGAKKITLKILDYNKSISCDHFSLIDGAFLS